MRKHLLHPQRIYQFVLVIFGLMISISFLRAEVTYALPLTGAELQIGNMLEWSTALEMDSERFVIQRSMDGISYEDIGRVDAAGLSKDETAYHFMDIGINNPKTYYRLKQIDEDGTASFSQTTIIHKVFSNKFMVMSMSSPEATKRFEIAIDFSEEGSIEYELCTLSGEKIVEVDTTVGVGLNSLFFDLENENEGIYKINIRMGGEEETLVIRKVLDEVRQKPNVASKTGEIGG